MRFGILTLGRINVNTIRYLLEGAHKYIAFKRVKSRPREVEGTISLEEVVSRTKPIATWVIASAGTTEQMVEDVRRVPLLHEEGINKYVDIETSGDWGCRGGYCLRSSGGCPEQQH